MKKLSIVLLAMALVLACVFTACEVTPEPEQPDTPATYKVTLSTGDGYTLSGEKTIEEGRDYSFTLSISAGYEKSADFAVKANGVALTEADGKYTLKAVSADVNIAVTGIVKTIVKHSVALPTGEGYTISGEAQVVDGQDYTFTISAATGFNIDSVVVKVNGESLDNNGNVGEYTVEEVTSDLTITVEGVARNTLAVTLTNGIGYKLDGEKNATYGIPYSFKLVINSAFKSADGFAVKANGTALTAEEDGSYKVANPTEALAITVEGVAIDETKKANFFYAPKNDKDASFNANIVYDAETDTFTTKSVQNTNSYDVAIDPDVIAWYKAAGCKYLAMYYNNTNGNVSNLVLYNDADTAKYLVENGKDPINGLVFANHAFVSAGKGYLLLDLDSVYVSENGLYLCMRDGGDGQTVQFSEVKFSQNKPAEFDLISMLTLETDKSQAIMIDGGIAISLDGENPITISKSIVDGWIADGKNTLSFRIKIKENGALVKNKNLWGDYPNPILSAATDFDADKGIVVSVDLTDSRFSNGITLRADNISLVFYLTEINLSHTDYASVTLTEGTGYTLTGETRVVKGQNYTFSIALSEGYVGGKVLVNGKQAVVDPQGNVTVENVSEDLTITVQDVQLSTYQITVPTGDGFEVKSSSKNPVDYNGSYAFSVELKAGYTQSTVVVKDGEKVLTPADGVYTIANVKEAHTITVEGVALNSYNVSLPTSTNYTVTGSASVTHGATYDFTVAFPDGIDTTDVKIYSQIGDAAKVEVVKADNKYSVANVTGALTITVEGLKVAKYDVTLTPADGISYKSENDGEPATQVEHGSTYKFKVVLNTAKYNGTLVVKNGDTTLTADENGIYSVQASAAIVITVSGMQINTYTVTLPTAEGYTITAADGSASPVNYGGSFSFTLAINSGYVADELVVKANGTAISATEGKYTVSNITANATITVEGVQKDEFNANSLYKAKWYTGTVAEGTKQITVQPGATITSDWVQAAIDAGYTHLRFDFTSSGDGTTALINNSAKWQTYYRTPSVGTTTTVRIDLSAIVDDDGKVTSISFANHTGASSDYVISNVALFKSTETKSWTKSATGVYCAIEENGHIVLDTLQCGAGANVLTTAEWWAKYSNNSKANEVSQLTVLVYGRYLTVGSNTRGMVFGRHSVAEHVIGGTASTEFIYETLNDTTYTEGEKFYMGLDSEGVFEFGISDFLSNNNALGNFKYVSETSESITVTLAANGKLVYVPTQDLIAAGYTKIKITASAYTTGQLWVGNDSWSGSNSYMHGLNSGATQELDLTSAKFDSANPYLVIMAANATIENVTITVSFQ